MKVKFAPNLQMYGVTLRSKPFTLPFSLQQELARERVTSVMYLAGNKILFILYVVIVLCITYHRCLLARGNCNSGMGCPEDDHQGGGAGGAGGAGGGGEDAS